MIFGIILQAEKLKFLVLQCLIHKN